MREEKDKESERCVLCGSDKILKIKCKIICQNCGFKRDCSDP